VVPAPRRRRQQAERDRGNDRQHPIHEHGGDRSCAGAAEADEKARQRELDDADASGGDRQSTEQADE
jgi:hypothetical protein